MSSVAVPGLNVEGTPLWIALVSLFAIVLVRSHATYWAARAASQGTSKLVARGTHSGEYSRHQRVAMRIDRWTTSAHAERAMRLVARWGPPAVTLAYVTVGAQTAILLAAGLLRMPYLRFTIASLPGAAAWAVIWATVGFGVFWAAVRLAAASPWAAGFGGLLLVVAVIWWVRQRRLSDKNPAAHKVP